MKTKLNGGKERKLGFERWLKTRQDKTSQAKPTVTVCLISLWNLLESGIAWLLAYSSATANQRSACN